MPSIRLTKFGGIIPEVSARLLPKDGAQIAHNCLLWDGSLRPLAKWGQQSQAEWEDVYSINIAPDQVTVARSNLKDASFLQGDMYPDNTQVGISLTVVPVSDSNIYYANRYTDLDGKPIGVHKPSITASSVTYSPQLKSDKPVHRFYGITGYRQHPDGAIEESEITILGDQDYKDIIYEGDIATVYAFATSINGEPYNGLKLYRTVSGFAVGSEPTNQADTKWVLVDVFPNVNSFTYADDGVPTRLAMDTYLSDRFCVPKVDRFSFLHVLEGGWIAAATEDGFVGVSERYLYHAWPSENTWKLPETITDCAAQDNTLFIGTTNRPYMLSISIGEKLGVQGDMKAFPSAYACNPGTMDTMPSGAIYTSSSGVVALTREGMKVLSAGVSSSILPLYNIPAKVEIVVDGNTHTITKEYPMRYEHAVYGAYYHGSYVGFCRVDSGTLDGEGGELYYSKGFMFNTASSLDGDKPLQRLVTLDTPDGVRAHTIGGSGLYVLAAGGVWRMPFPDSADAAYVNAKKYCYTWKSKKFVFPGNMVMAACKVDHDCGGHLRIKFFADCCCLYETVVTDCKPFLLPPDMAGVVWEIELDGTSTVHEVHVASSLRELLEQ